MLDGFISGLFVAWILSFFKINEMIIEVIQPCIIHELTNSHYYVLFGVIGLINGAFSN